MTIVTVKNNDKTVYFGNIVRRLKKIQLFNCICDIKIYYRDLVFKKLVLCDVIVNNSMSLKLTPLNNAEDYSCEIYGENSPDDHYLSREYVDIDEKYDNDESNDSYIMSKGKRVFLFDDENRRNRNAKNNRIFTSNFPKEKYISSLLIIDNEFKELMRQNTFFLGTVYGDMFKYDDTIPYLNLDNVTNKHVLIPSHNIV